MGVSWTPQGVRQFASRAIMACSHPWGRFWEACLAVSEDLCHQAGGRDIGGGTLQTLARSLPEPHPVSTPIYTAAPKVRGRASQKGPTLHLRGSAPSDFLRGSSVVGVQEREGNWEVGGRVQALRQGWIGTSQRR